MRRHPATIKSSLFALCETGKSRSETPRTDYFGSERRASHGFQTTRGDSCAVRKTMRLHSSDNLCGVRMQDHFGPALVAVVEVLVSIGRFHQR